MLLLTMQGGNKYFALLSLFLCVSHVIGHMVMTDMLDEDLVDDTNTTTAPTVAPATTPVTPSDEEKFAVFDKTTGQACLLVAFNASFQLPYFQTDGKTNVATIDFQRALSTYTGQCSNDSETLNIVWKPQSDSVSGWTLELNFVPTLPDTPQPISKGDGKYKLANLTLTYDVDNVTFPNTNYTGGMTLVLKTPDRLVKASVGETYHCDAERSMAFNAATPGVGEPQLKLRDLRVDAFRHNRNDTNFADKQWLCNEDVPLSYVVPLIVGIVLVVLVIVGLVAYFLGRHQTSRSSYQPM